MKFRNDVSNIVPTGWGDARVDTSSLDRRKGLGAVDEEEERRGMLRGDRLEMSER